jgi:hypothetical protein
MVTLPPAPAMRTNVALHGPQPRANGDPQIPQTAGRNRQNERFAPFAAPGFGRGVDVRGFAIADAAVHGGGVVHGFQDSHRQTHFQQERLTA